MDAIQKVDSATLTELSSLPDAIFYDRKSPQIRNILRKKLSAVKQEKQTLEELISVRNAEIEELKNTVKCLKESVDSNINGIEDSKISAITKINELKKKNHELKTDLDFYKNKNVKHESKIQALESELRKAAQKQKEEESKKTTDPTLDALQSKLEQTKRKLFDSLNQNVELKNHLKLAQKCIQKEIGENVNLNQLASAGTSWRGRSQQILTMQMKINELKTHLDHVRSEFGLSDEYLTDVPHVRKDQINHKIDVENLKKEITTLKSTIEEQNQKMSALKARNTNLVTEVTKFKEKCTNLEAIEKNTQNALKALTDKLEAQKYHYDNRIQEIQKQILEAHRQRAEYEFQREETQIKLDNTLEESQRKDDQIAELKSAIKKLERDLKAVCGDYLFECRDFKKEEFSGLIQALESEKDNLLLLNKTLNQRLDGERTKSLEFVNQISKQKVKICRLEGKIRDLEKDLESIGDRKRRSQRILEYSSNINTGMLPTFVFEHSSAQDIPNNGGGDQSNTLFEIEDLKNKLEISREKITILEDKLNYLNEEKQSDTQTFENIIKMSKSVLLDTINQIKSNSSTEFTKQ